MSKNKLHEFTATYEVTRPDGHIEASAEITAWYRFSPGRPATPPAYDHGGLPPDPPEIDIVHIDQDGERVTNSGDFDRFRDWLIDRFEGAMIAQAEDGRAYEREEAAERRWEQRRDDRLTGADR